MKTPLSILLTSGVCAAQLAFSASLVPNGGFEQWDPGAYPQMRS